MNNLISINNMADSLYISLFYVGVAAGPWAHALAGLRDRVFPMPQTLQRMVEEELNE